MVAPAFNLTVLRSYPLTLLPSQTNINSPANALTPQPGEKAVFHQDFAFEGGTFASTISFDLGSAKDVDQLAVLYHNSPDSSSYVRVICSNSATFSSAVEVLQFPLTDSGGETTDRPLGYRHAFWSRVGQPVTCRYLSVSVVSANQNDVSVGRILAGKAIQPEFNSDYGDTSWGYDEAPDPDLLDSGVEVLYEHTPAPVMSFQLSWVSEVEMNRDWEPLSRLQWTGDPVLVARRPDPHADRHNGLFYGRLRMRPIVAQDFDMYEVQGQIRSMV